MATYTQKQRPMEIKAPVGDDKLLVLTLTGQEGLSQLFNWQVECLAENATEIAFDKMLGQLVTVRVDLAGGKKRFFNGLCKRIIQGEQDRTFTSYRLELVPSFWTLTKRAQSRIFQHENIPDILKKVLKGLDVTWEIQGTFQPRNYCVQYRETDFNFACRIMEEEGMYYFFKHADGSHKMVVANTPGSHPDTPEGSTLIYENIGGGSTAEGDRVYDWEKAQELRAGKYTLFDHKFELPHKHLEADKGIQDSVQSGGVSHKLKVGGNDQFEIYDYPGEYAQRFDGIDRGGAERGGEMSKIFEDNKRTVGIRMQEEAAQSLIVRGASNCRQVISGHKIALERHFNANGEYVVTQVYHHARVGGDYRSGQNISFDYHNNFSCIPSAVPFRPQRVTPKPTVQGTQTAVVVGPGGEEIFVDKYSRVKVQFHWDRQGKNDQDSACWCRVATPWAGKQWGMIHIPRIGQEVVVQFLEGDPDQPIIVGSVYNAEQMPPYELPANKTQCGIKSRSSLGGSPANFNEIRFEDKKGDEQLFIHAEKNQDIEVENDETHWVGHDRRKTIDHNETTHVKHDRTETVDNNEKISIHGARTEVVDKNETITIHGMRTEEVDKDEKITIRGARMEQVEKNETIEIAGNREETVKKNETVTVNENRSHAVIKNDTLDVGKVLTITAGDQVTIKTGDASIVMKKNGDIVIKGKNITLDGSGKINAKASSDVIVKGSKIAQN